MAVNLSSDPSLTFIDGIEDQITQVLVNLFRFDLFTHSTGNPVENIAGLQCLTDALHQPFIKLVV